MEFKIEKNNGENLFTVSDANTITIFKFSEDQIKYISDLFTDYLKTMNVPNYERKYNPRSKKWEIVN